MKRLVKAEVRKLLTTRTAFGLLAGMVILAGPGVFLSGQTSLAELSKPLQDQVWFFISAGFTRLLVVILGIRAMTDEFRHGTIVPSLLITPDRRRFLIAKAATAAGAGFVFTLIAQALGLAVAVGFIAASGADVTINSETVRAFAGTTIAGILWAVIGVALGAIIRRQIPAIVGSLVWLMPGGGLEDVIRERLGAESGRYLPGNEGMALALATDKRALWWGVIVLATYGAVLLAAGVLVTKARDVTA